MKKLRAMLTNLLILGGITALTAFLFLTIYPYKTFKVNSAKVLTPIVKVGETMFYEVDYCKATTLGSSVQRQIVSDTVAIPYPPVTSVAKEGCHKVKIPLLIGDSTPPGTYILRVSATYQINALRTITTNFETDSFKVTKE